MEILKKPDTQIITATFSVSSSGSFVLDYEDLLTGETFSASANSSYGAVTFELDSKYLKYNGNLSATVKDSQDNIVFMTGLDIVRPYCDLESLATALNILDGSEVNYERVARYIIDSQTQGFGFVRKQKEIVGNGSDYLPVDEKISSIFKVYENRVLMYDSERENNEHVYKITKDKSAIVRVHESSPENRVNYKKVWRDRSLGTDFADGYEYVVDAEYGYKVIPGEIQEACELLIQDMKSNTNKYSNQYIESFDNEDFKIKFRNAGDSSTGNKIVDKILEKYKNDIRLGVL